MSCKQEEVKLLQIIKKILTTTNVLDETLILKNQKVYQNVGEDQKGQESVFNEKNISNLANKIQKVILSSNEFKEQIHQILEKKVKEAVTETRVEIQLLKDHVEEAEQYSRRNCLLLHGVLEKRGENTDEFVKTFCKENLDFEITNYNLNRSHRLKKSSNAKDRPAPIIAKFVQHNVKAYLYNRKKCLKGTGYLMTESLTKKRMELIKKLKRLRNEKKINSFWSLDGRIYFDLIKDGSIFHIKCMKDIDSALSKV